MSSALNLLQSTAQIGLQYKSKSAVRFLVTSQAKTVTVVMGQVTIEEVHNDEMEITDHPVERGSVISDHAFARPAEVIITAGWSNSPTTIGPLNQLTGAAASASSLLRAVIGASKAISGIQAMFNPGPSVTEDTYRVILGLYNNRELFDVYTGKRIYKDMLIKSLATTTDVRTENSLILRMTLRQIIQADTQTVTVPDASKMASPESNGATINRGTISARQANSLNINALP
ncbi:phage baseplate protein [Herbaspirillum huttiense]|uniref:phage baseplate protein n=1 Tax=Herbaspirillum huttiense TaxID=863372 RepID=UPI0031DEB523